jgi:hypothetical protein
MQGYQTFISAVLAVILSIVIIRLPIFIHNKKKANETEKDDTNNIKKHSKIISIVWIILFIPSLFVTYIVVVGIAMGGEAVLSSIGSFQIICLGTSLFLFLAFPPSIIIAVILSTKYRFEQEMELSVSIQFTPLYIITAAIIFPVIMHVSGVMLGKI